MNVKVDALVRIQYGTYYHDSDSLIIEYAYKIRGFKRKSGYIYLESKRNGESYNEFTNRVIKRLESLSHDEVIELTKIKVTTDVENILKDKSTDDKLKSLLKDFKTIKFTFKVKDRL
jgi:hypothetical protein